MSNLKGMSSMNNHFSSNSINMNVDPNKDLDNDAEDFDFLVSSVRKSSNLNQFSNGTQMFLNERQGRQGNVKDSSCMPVSPTNLICNEATLNNQRVTVTPLSIPLMGLS